MLNLDFFANEYAKYLIKYLLLIGHKRYLLDHNPGSLFEYAKLALKISTVFEKSCSSKYLKIHVEVLLTLAKY
jgi:hypothetical protein